MPVAAAVVCGLRTPVPLGQKQVLPWRLIAPPIELSVSVSIHIEGGHSRIVTAASKQDLLDASHLPFVSEARVHKSELLSLPSLPI